MDAWTPLRLVAVTQDFFAKKDVDAPRLTAELLLGHALGCDRVRLYLDFDKPIAEPELARYRELVRRRADGEPTAYLIGAREFYGHRFKVDARVLVPRPETELLVEAALAALPERGRALDLCTGSGCVAIALALARPSARVLATDVSDDALAVAKENATAMGLRQGLGAGDRVELAAGDLWAAVHGGGRFDVIASNPPYIPAKELPGLPREVRREPCIALDGGEDGLSVLRRIVEGAPAHLAPGGVLCLEMHESHVETLPALCRAAGFEKVEARRDYAGLPRFTVAALPAHEEPA
jgi:release factor glutamine methyltransferase